MDKACRICGNINTEIFYKFNFIENSITNVLNKINEYNNNTSFFSYFSLSYDANKERKYEMTYLLNNIIRNIESMLKSGLHPSMLSDEEKFILKDILGDKWYEKYGYVKEDLHDIVTLKIN